MNLIDREFSDGTFELEIVGEVDLATAPELRTRLLHSIEIEGRRATWVDFARCTFIDSIALSVILEAARLLDERLQKLHIVNLAGQPRQLFELTGVDRAVGIEPDLATAAGRERALEA